MKLRATETPTETAALVVEPKLSDPETAPTKASTDDSPEASKSTLPTSSLAVPRLLPSI